MFWNQEIWLLTFLWKIQPFLCLLQHVNWQASAWIWSSKGGNVLQRTCYILSPFRYSLLRWWSTAGELEVGAEMLTYYCMIHWFRYQASEDVTVKMWARHGAFSVFARILVFWNFLAGKSICEIHVKARQKSG